MKVLAGFIKVKQYGQSQAGAGWNKHVNKFQKRIGNKVIRRVNPTRSSEVVTTNDHP